MCTKISLPSRGELGGPKRGIRHRLLLGCGLQESPSPSQRKYWVRAQNLAGETNVFSSLPMLPDKVDVHCDSCGEENSYKRKEIMRDEVQVPEVFVPHPLFKTV